MIYMVFPHGNARSLGGGLSGIDSLKGKAPPSKKNSRFKEEESSPEKGNPLLFLEGTSLSGGGVDYTVLKDPGSIIL